MKFKWDKKYLYWGTTSFIVIITSIVFFFLMHNLRWLTGLFSNIISLVMPFIAGFIIAYLLYPIVHFFETMVFSPILKAIKIKKYEKPSRIIAIILTLSLALAFVVGLLFLVIPQLIDSIEGIIANLPIYFSNLQTWTSSLLSKNSDILTLINEQFEDLNSLASDFAKNSLPKLNSVINGVTVGVIGFLVSIKNILIGLIISIYLLYSKERFFAQIKKTLYAICKIPTTNYLIKVTKRADKVFGGFITGKLLDSLIIGILCFIGMSFFKMPYPLLISVIIGITNIIPFFGPFFGAVPSALLILMIDPLTCLYFCLFVLGLQLFDGYILGPLILGDSTGLSAFWVIFAILLSGGLFGFTGMVVGVPLFALIYSLLSEWIDHRLKKNKLPVSTKLYYDVDKIDTLTHEFSFNEKTPLIKGQKANTKNKAKKKQ